MSIMIPRFRRHASCRWLPTLRRDVERPSSGFNLGSIRSSGSLVSTYKATLRNNLKAH
jgi:hypothetical protein